MRTSLFSVVLVSLLCMDSLQFIIGYTVLPFAGTHQRIFSTRLFQTDGETTDAPSDDTTPLSRAPVTSFSEVPPLYNPGDKLELRSDKMNVGNPQILVLEENDYTVTDILRELAAIRQEGPQKYCILGTRHCSYLHQQIIELLWVLLCSK